MSFLLAAYSPSAFQEFWLPETDNIDYPLLLDRETFHLPRDITVQLEILEGRWRFQGTEPLVNYGPDCIPAGKGLSPGDLIQLQDSGADVTLVVMPVSPNLGRFQKYRILSNCTLSIGSAQDNNICYDFHDMVTSHHAALTITDGACSVTDAGSVNGIFLDGRQISQASLAFGQMVDIVGLHLIWLGEILAVGAADGSFEIHAGALRPLPAAAPVQSPPPLPEAPPIFRRSPRVLPKIYSDPIEIEMPPQPQKLPKRPLLLTIGPSLTMALPMILGATLAISSARAGGGTGGTYMYTGILIAVSSALLGTMWALLNLSYTKKQAKLAERRRSERYAQYLIDIAKTVKDQYQHNNSALNQMYPAPEICAGYGRSSPQLWARNFSHPDFLYHRVGIGSLPFQVPIVVPKKKFTLDEDELANRLQEIRTNFQTLFQVPVGVDLMARRLWGITGSREARQTAARTLITQIAANNCYTDVKLVFLLDYRGRRDGTVWNFARWLPHVWSEDGRTRYFAANRNERGEVAYELNNILRSRSENQELSRKQIYRPQYVVFVEREDLLEGESISKYLLGERDLGVTTILLAEHAEELPNVCVNLLQTDEPFRGIYHVEEGEESRQPLTLDQVSLEDAEALSRRLASIKVSQLGRGGDLPDELTFLEMMGVQTLEELNVLERWRKNRTYESMRALIGQKAGGLDCYLDIHEKYHGPHGLLAGTTGSGKSETLQTYILSLAVNFSPDDVSFFIIDYKGGGMGNLFSGLPHVAGQISNLSGNQVHRAMVSIKSENRRRQQIFSEYGINHIDQYTRLFKQNEATLPLPHLFIVIDEFAELKREEEGFMRELISVAQVGRSLGVHLILATQKPSGNVDENILSNAKFRLCLRVQERQDSIDMLHKPDAAYITQAGRGYLQVGSDEIYELFQSGWSGAVYDEEAAQTSSELASMRTNTGRPAIVGNHAKMKQKEQQRKAWFSALIQIVRDAGRDTSAPEEFLPRVYRALQAGNWNYAPSKFNDNRLLAFAQLCRAVDLAQPGLPPDQAVEPLLRLSTPQQRLPECKGRTQLAAVVEYLAKVAQENQFHHCFDLWLPVLPKQLYWSEVADVDEVFHNGAWPERPGTLRLSAVVGRYDDPVHQLQMPLQLDLSEGGHTALCGSVVSGKSTFLQTMIFDLIHRYTPQEIHLYLIDMSSRLLSAFEGAPHVGGILYDNDLDGISKFFSMLEQMLSERKTLLKGGSFSQYIRSRGASLPALFLVIDNYAKFREKTENRYESLLFSLSREGLNYGLFLVVSSGGFSISELPNRIAENFRNVVCLEMGDRFKYADILHTLQFDVLPEAGVRGRGLVPVGESILEFQTALSLDAKDDYTRSELIQAVCAQMSQAWTGPRAWPIPHIPEKPTWSDLSTRPDFPALLDGPRWLPYAYYDADASIASVDLQTTYCWLISGRPRTGKTNLLRIFLRAIRAKGGEIAVIDLGSAHELEQDCALCGGIYLQTQQEISSYLAKLLNTFKERNQKKQSLLGQGKSEEEIFSEMSALPPIFLLIDSLEDFADAAYHPEAGVVQYSGFLENITEKGYLHNIYFLACVNPAVKKAAGRKIYDNILGYKTGIHLGGNVKQAQRYLNFSSVPFLEQEKVFKAGLGLLPATETESSVRQVVLPRAIPGEEIP